MKRLTRKQKAQKQQIKQVLFLSPLLVGFLVVLHFAGASL